jgi:nitroreductase
VELSDVIRRRHMVRSFSDRPLDGGLVASLLDDVGRIPTAGNTQGVAWLVLTGPEQTEVYWRHTTTEPWRARSRRWAGMRRAPVVALSLASPAAYVTRYGEPDKAGSGLGPVEAGEGGAAAWPVPYWFGDAAFATMLLLLRAAEAGVGAGFLGNFRGEEPLLAALGVPPGWRLFGAVMLGHPAGDEPRSASLDRPAPPPGALVRWGRWPSS